MPIDDSVVIAEGATGAIIATDLVTSGSTTANYQYVKMVWGPDGTVNPVTETGTSGPIPTQLYSNGVQITNTSGRLNVDLQGSGITLNTNLNAIGGVTLPDGAMAVTGDVAVSGTGVGVTGDVAVSATDLDIRSLYLGTAGFSGSYDTANDGVAVQGISGAFPVRVESGFYTNSGFTAFGQSGDALKVTLTDAVISGTGLGVTGDVAVSGTGLGVTGDVAVSATDLDIRSLFLGTAGFSGAFDTANDGLVVQGITGAFPVTTALGFVTGDGSVEYIGKSGDALKVAMTDASLNATVNINSVIGVESNSILAVSGVCGSSSEASPIYIQGTGGGTPVGITFAEGVSFDVSGSKIAVTSVSGTVTTSGTVTATDLDIRGITGGTWGATAGLGSLEDSIVVQGGTGSFPVAVALSGFTIDGTPVTLQTEVVDATTQILKTVIDGRGITNSTAIQIQGRNDGHTLDPVYVAGVGATGDVSPDEGLIGVTFDQLNGSLKVIGGLTAPQGTDENSLAALVHGASGSSVFPIGFTGDGDARALNVNMVNADGVSFSVAVSENLTVGNTLANPIPIQGACSDTEGATLFGVFVSGTASNHVPWPVMVQGYTTGAGANEPLVISDTTRRLGVFEEIIVGATGSLENINAGITGVSAAVHELSADIRSIHTQGTFANIDSQVGNIDSKTDLIESNLVSVINPTQSSPAKRVYVEVPPPSSVRHDAMSATSTVAAFSNNTLLKSGARFKLHPGADQVVFVGQGSNTSVFYPLSAGDDIFIEIDQISKISVFAPTAGTNLTVFALGF